MAANTTPIYIATPNITAVKLTNSQAIAGNDGASTGTGAGLLQQVWQAGANGGFIEKVRWIAVATTATSLITTPVALRVFLSSINTLASGTTNLTVKLLNEYVVSATTITVANASTSTTFWVDIPLNIPVNANDYIHASQSQAATLNCNWQCMVFGGNF